MLFSQINWHTIYWSIGLQFLCALLALKFKPGRDTLFWMQDRLNEYFANTKPASELLFGKTYKDHNIIFGVILLYIIKIRLDSRNDLRLLPFYNNYNDKITSCPLKMLYKMKFNLEVAYLYTCVSVSSAKLSLNNAKSFLLFFKYLPKEFSS